MYQSPDESHCLRLAGISASLTSFIFASYAFLLNQEASYGKGFFSFLIYFGITSTIFSLIAYSSPNHRTGFFYAALSFIVADFIIMGILFWYFYLI